MVVETCDRQVDNGRDQACVVVRGTRQPHFGFSFLASIVSLHQVLGVQAAKQFALITVPTDALEKEF